MTKKLLGLLLTVVLLATACEAGPPSPSELAEANRKNAEAAAILKSADAKATATAQESADKTKLANAQVAATLAEKNLNDAKADTERRLANVEVETRTRLGQANVDAVALNAWADTQRKIYQTQLDAINAQFAQIKDKRLFELGQESEVEWDYIKRSLTAWFQLPLAYLLGVFLAGGGLMFVMYVRFRLTLGHAYILTEPGFMTRLAANFTHQSLLTVAVDADGAPRAFVEVWVRGPNAWRSYAVEDAKAAQIAATLNGAARLTSGVLAAAQSLPPSVAADLTVLSAKAAAGALQSVEK